MMRFTFFSALLVVSSVFSLNTRKSISFITTEEYQSLRSGLVTLKASGWYDILADIHTNPVVFYQVHNTFLFCAWHRWYIWIWERALQTALGNTSFTIPYWNSSDPLSTFLLQGTFLDPHHIGCISNDSLWVHPGTTSCVSREPGRNHSLPTWDVWQAALDMEDDMHFCSHLEMYPHAQVHRYIKGDMSSMASPQDPVFLLHHTFVDFIWWKRQRSHTWTGHINESLPNASHIFLGDMLNVENLGYVYAD